jgi:hypothetical protein
MRMILSVLAALQLASPLAQAAYSPKAVISSVARERVERVAVDAACSGSPCTIADQSGSWVSNVTRSSTGIYSVNIAAGVFSAKPTCVCSSPGAASNAWCQAYTGSTSAVGIQTQSASGTSVDTNFKVICMGPR